MPTCCRELADHSGALPHGRARHTAASAMRKVHVGSMARAPRVIAGPGQHLHDRARMRNRTSVEASGAHTPVVPTPSTIIPLTALSCGRTFPDSAVMMASMCAGGRPALTRWLDLEGVLSMFHCRVKRAGLKGRATDFHNFVPSGSSP